MSLFKCLLVAGPISRLSSRLKKKVDRRDVPNPLGPSRGIFPSGRCEKIDFAEISSEPKCILQAQRFRLIPRRAQVDSERDLGAHRVFESLIHEDIVVHSSTSDSVIRRADDMGARWRVRILHRVVLRMGWKQQFECRLWSSRSLCSANYGRDTYLYRHKRGFGQLKHYVLHKSDTHRAVSSLLRCEEKWGREAQGGKIGTVLTQTNAL